MARQQRILVVEDEPMVAEVVERYLRRDGFAVRIEGDGVGGLRASGEYEPDLVVLDLMLPNMTGIELCRRLRAAGSTPVIMLTARGEEADRLEGLGTGADDYMVKPFSPRELVARVRAVLRRSGASAAETLRFAGVTIDPCARAVTTEQGAIALTEREFDLLVHFATHPKQAFSRDRLLDAVWGHDFEGDTSTVTVHVRRLREKLEDDPAHPRHIRTVWGVGYRFEP